MTVTKLHLKPPSDDSRRRPGEPSLLGGRFAAAAKTASKAETCFIRADIGFRRCLGHRNDIWSNDAVFRAHIKGGIRWALGLE
jgi:hypothetical protein